MWAGAPWAGPAGGEATKAAEKRMDAIIGEWISESPLIIGTGFAVTQRLSLIELAREIPYSSIVGSLWELEMEPVN
ncbi:MAG: hypothetical protein Fur0036_09420 [Fimbriimonadaceae bacterium]